MKFLNPAISVTGMHTVRSQSASSRAHVARQSLSGQFKSSAFSDLNSQQPHIWTLLISSLTEAELEQRGVKEQGQSGSGGAHF